MGDIADWLIDQQLDYGDFWFSNHRPIYANVTCRRCGETGLRWRDTGKRFVLMKYGTLHDCTSVQPGEFEDLTQEKSDGQ